MKTPRFAHWCSAVCCAAVAAGACTATSLSGRKVNDLPIGDFKKIVVMGFFNAEDDRATFEDRVAQALHGTGRAAVASLDILEHGVEYTRQEMGDIFLQEGFDAVLILRISGVHQVRTDSPGGHVDFTDPYAHSWYPYWRYGMVFMIRGGGTHEKHDVVSMESGLFSMETEKLVWIGQSETKRVESVAALADSVGSAVARELRKDALIP